MLKHPKLKSIVGAVCACQLAAAPSVFAEMIVLTGGEVRVGRILSETPVEIRLLTGNTSKSREVTLDRAEIVDVCRGLKESERIDACKNADLLGQWAAAYFQGNLEIPATRCIRRLLEVDSAVGSEPRRHGADEFRRFRNRVIFRELTFQASKGEPDRQLQLAKWARQAELTSEAARFLRRAWSADPASAEIRSLAAEWGVRLAPQFRLDLTPALNESLFSDFIFDEGNRVNAESGKEFLTLPVRYDQAEPDQVLTRSTFRFKDVRGVYGLRLLRVKGGVPVLETLAREAVYERIEVCAEAGGSREIVVRNTSGPRMADGAEHPERIGPKERRLRGNGWAAIVVEAPKNGDSLVISGADGISEILDLSMLRRIRDPLGSGMSALATPAFTATLAALRTDTFGDADTKLGAGTMASLAIARLERWRDRPGSNPTDEWIQVVDRAVIEAATRDEERIGASAWHYLASRGHLPEETANLIVRQSEENQERWIRIIERAAENESGFDSRVASSIIRSILRGNNTNACESALDFMIESGPSADWSVLVGASSIARSLAHARLASHIDSDTASNMLVALMQGVDPDWADELSRLARHLNLRLSDGDHPILKSWRSLTENADRIAFLRMLRSVSLERVIHSSHFSELLRDATKASSATDVREAAFQLIVEEGRRQESAESAGFGLLIPRDAGDPLIRGLSKAVRFGTPETRIDAMEILVRAGFAEEAVRGVVAGVSGEQNQDRVFMEFLKRLEAGSPCDGIHSFMATLVRPAWPSSAQYAITRLKQRAAATDKAARWRVFAASKSGTNFRVLSDSSFRMKPPLSITVLGWLLHLTHASTQERKRLIAAHDPDERFAFLRDIDFRRGQLVDGRYGVAAIMETVSAAEESGGRIVWSTPQREVLILPALTLRLSGDENSYIVKWGDREIGVGLVLDRPQPIRRLRLEYYYGVMEQLEASPFVGGATVGAGPASSRPSEESIGPIALRSAKVETDLTPGTMLLDVAELLKAGLEASGGHSPAGIAPESLEMTLRYTAFGGYCGTAERRALPERVPVGHRCMLNLKLILERAD